MLRDGPVPRAVHGAIEYVAAIAFIVVPLLLEYRSGAAVATSIIVGIVILVVAATTEGPTSLVNQIPIAAHAVLDYLLAIFLIAAPFLFGFSDETAPLVFFITLGVAHLLLTIATRFVPEGAEATHGGRRGRLRRADDEERERDAGPSTAPAAGATGASTADPRGDEGTGARPRATRSARPVVTG
jgi:hypothetical protein